MSLATELVLTSSVIPESIRDFRDRLDSGWIEQALEATVTATIRRRRLPAEQVVWLVIGMAMIRDRRIEEVVSKLGLALPVPSRRTVAPASIPPARERLGVEPMRWLFERTGRVWGAEGANDRRRRGLAVYGIDGTTLQVADSPENRETVGGQYSGEKRGDSGYPMVRLLALMALRTHVLAGATC